MSITHQFNRIKAYGLIKLLASMSLLFLAYSICSSSAYAESCWVSGGNLSLGTANIQGSMTASTDITVTCNSNWSQPVTYKICMVVDSIDPAAKDPRTMINYDNYPASLLNYNLYYDVARTRKIPNSDAKNTAQCQSIQVGANTGSPSTLVKMYGQVLAGQNVPAGSYKTNSTSIKLYYAYRYGLEVPSDLEALASQNNIATNYIVVNSNYENSCLILFASDIDFGSVELLNNTLYRSGTIQLACPTSTNMKVSLNNGINPLGSQRRMKNSLGSYIQYSLYQDPSHSNAWQADTLYSITNHTIPVYAIVPSQSISSIGKYSDIITVTLTY
ncbi:spore coat protein U domain-containing protein [Acinetobacter sp. NIOH-H-8]|uniref:Csu type fimbrial protein n=1 Tax=Acinetobacter sp. NIOH-H-8 TaxID=3342120 RepID=UPI003985E229